MKRSDKRTKKPNETSVEVAMPEDEQHRFELIMNGLPVPRLNNVSSAGYPDSTSWVAAPTGEIEFEVECMATGDGAGRAEVEYRAWYSDTGEPVPNEILDEPEWADPIERAAEDYLRDRYETNCDPDEWIRSEY